MEERTDIPKRTKKRRGINLIVLLVVLTTIIFILYVRLQFNPPENFIETQTFEITSGMSVRDIAIAATEQHVVRSEFLLYSILTYSYDTTNIYAGTYIFDDPVSVFGVAHKLASKEIENKLIRITIPEGMRITQIADLAQSALPSFDSQEYLLDSSRLEGYLFPETYFVPETYTASDLIALQRKTYEENIQPLREDIAVLNLTEYDVLILASIVEREANDETSMKMVAGILLNRLKIGMPLQTDASIGYIFDVPLKELPQGQLAQELRETDSPYNTYLYTGLPPTPIGNPGIMAIDAVVHPTVSENLFYITAQDGTFYYAKTFSQHNRNIARYLQ